MPDPNQLPIPGLEPSEPPTVPVDTEAVVAGAREFDPNKPVSRAAEDQGWGPVDLSDDRTATRQPKPRKPSSSVRGFHDATPKPEERGDGVQKLSPLQEFRNRAGVIAARAIIEDVRTRIEE